MDGCRHILKRKFLVSINRNYIGNFLLVFLFICPRSGNARLGRGFYAILAERGVLYARLSGATYIVMFSISGTEM